MLALVQTTKTTTWGDVGGAAPDLARAVEARFEATGLGFLATLRADGSPRLSGIEPFFWDGELWLGMMPGSLKAADAVRDPRVALHAATVDKEVKDGDAKVAGRLVPVTSTERHAAMSAAFLERTGYDPGSFGDFPLFTLDVTEAVFTRPADGALVIEWWTPEGGVRRVDRK